MAFVAFEGLDGSGKSTLIRALVAELESRQIQFVVTREPGGTPLGEAMRNMLLSTSGDAPVARTELLLYEASRAQHVEQLIRPELAKGHWVLCDRFSASSIAFQEGGRGLATTDVEWLNDFATDKLYPDLWVLLDISTDESARRMSQRTEESGQELDRFEQEKRDFHERVRASYLRQAQAEPKNWLVLDASQSPEDLSDQLMSALAQRGLM